MKFLVPLFVVLCVLTALFLSGCVAMTRGEYQNRMEFYKNGGRLECLGAVLKGFENAEEYKHERERSIKKLKKEHGNK